ncbi:MAG: RidA family protein [Acidiferrobacteraceae bacterium]|jgi:enamine deaminase RidA (YjgF/YER057c/UK114 family)|nr:RidA family protein [Acidiferrobacteraceae bacterium]MBT3770644.1 RidA family protein [Acidiferrobacteraceae bacterium]MBT4806095.1 RidA family protein [Acidiferrobacteraceae bacterium]MBT5622334.1 RidA family protein [Acidiferrobacteraceae bacterium]MBT7518185.1 RidA family protein [Acidiferrobacteraceae bacterium]
MPQIERLLLDNLPAPVSHYCHVVRAGDRVWVSGMVGIRKDGSIPEDVVDQFEVAMDWLDRALRAAGGRPEHIVKVQVFLTDINDRAKINPLRQDYFGKHRPASTLVEVSALITPQLKVEIEAEAILG